MKMKTFSKLMAIALMAIMTTCLTSCEDERTIPVQGSGISDDSVHHNLSPNPPAETKLQGDLVASAFIRSADIAYDENLGEYIYVYVFITNNTDEKTEAWKLAQAVVLDDQGLSLMPIYDNLMGEDREDMSLIIKPDTQDFVIQKFQMPSWDTEFIDVNVSVWDNGSQDYVITDTRRLYLTEE